MREACQKQEPLPELTSVHFMVQKRTSILSWIQVQPHSSAGPRGRTFPVLSTLVGTYPVVTHRSNVSRTFMEAREGVLSEISFLCTFTEHPLCTRLYWGDKAGRDRQDPCPGKVMFCGANRQKNRNRKLPSLLGGKK